MNKKISSTAKKLISSSIKNQLGRIILTSFLSLIGSVSYIALALISKKIIDIAAGDVQGKMLPYALAIFALVITQVSCAGAASHLKVSTSGRMAMNIRKGLFSTVLSKQLNEVNEYHSGDLLNRFASDTDVVVNTASSIIPNIVSIISRIISGSIAILFIDWKFGAGLIILGITVPAICKLVGHKYRYLHTLHQQTDGKLKSFLQESFKNLSVIKSFSSLNPLNRKLNKFQKDNYNIKIKRNNLSIFYSLGMYLFFTAGYFLVLLWGAMGIKEGIVTYGSLLAFLQIISQLRAPMQSVSGIIPAYESMVSSAQRLSQIIDLKDELLPLSKQVSETVENVFTCIKGEGVSFNYGELTVLNNCSFNIKRGSITTITGESGVGKSTLFKLLLGYEALENGKISFDGKYPINASTRSLFSYVPQGNMILSGTIRENITLCCEKTTEQKIEQAIKVAQLTEWINTLEDGLDTYLGEDGLGVSEGQAQRIAIARALLCDAPILLLDEATAALDIITEEALLNALKNLKDKTVILVTHRSLPQSICDNHLHLDGGVFKAI